MSGGMHAELCRSLCPCRCVLGCRCCLFTCRVRCLAARGSVVDARRGWCAAAVNPSGTVLSSQLCVWHTHQVEPCDSKGQGAGGDRIRSMPRHTVPCVRLSVALAALVCGRAGSFFYGCHRCYCVALVLLDSCQSLCDTLWCDRLDKETAVQLVLLACVSCAGPASACCVQVFAGRTMRSCAVACQAAMHLQLAPQHSTPLLRLAHFAQVQWMTRHCTCSWWASSCDGAVCSSRDAFRYTLASSSCHPCAAGDGLCMHPLRHSPSI